jgi:hypothetical protein
LQIALIRCEIEIHDGACEAGADCGMILSCSSTRAAWP